MCTCLYLLTGKTVVQSNRQLLFLMQLLLLLTYLLLLLLPPQPLLPSFDLEGIAQLILSGRVQRIVMMVGAGISVSAGIPDFRTPGTGLYRCVWSCSSTA